MPSRKRANLSPLPESVWYSAGRSAVKGSAHVIEQRLNELREAGTVEEFVRHDYPESARPSQLFDALWRPDKGTVIRGRLVLVGREHDPMFTWEIIAEASRPWEWSWSSPATMFWPKSRDSTWDAVGAHGARSYRSTTFVDSPKIAADSVRAALDAQADIHVLTTDDEPDRPAHQLVPLVRYLPAGFTGRVIEQRVSPQALDAVNHALAPAGLRLPPQTTCPASWEEVVERTAAELDRIVLGDVLATSRPLRGHTSETSWLRRTWEALRALDAYARAKSEHGPEMLPHLSAYLSWTDAAVSLPRSRYSANESQLVLTTLKLRDERVLPVPRDVDPSGRVLMTEHIRIGSGRPPAPRLHLYDNSANDGRIYVGHIGPHLRNSHTN